MADSLLAIVQKACGRVNMPKPSSVIGNPDQVTSTMLDLLQEEGEELMRAYEWSWLVREGASITLVAGQASYPLPTDFDRLVANTTWDRTYKLPAIGPDSLQEARARQEAIVAPVDRITFRQAGNFLNVWPVPTVSGGQVAFDYVSNQFCASTTGVTQAAWAADTDVPVLPANLFILGLRWRWLQMQRFDFSTELTSYQGDVKRARARDQGGGKKLRLDRGSCRDYGPSSGVIGGQPQVIIGTSDGSSILVD